MGIGRAVLPSFRLRPQGGGTASVDQRAVFTAVVYVLTSGCAWRYLPPTFGVPPATAYRRFSVWTASGRPRQSGRQTARSDRRAGAAHGCWGVRRERQRCPGAWPARPRDPGCPLAPRPSPTTPRQGSADKAYHSSGNLAWLRERNITPRIARPGVESSERLGRHRWKIERSISWLFGYRRLTVRYERKGGHFLAFLGLAAAMTCYKLAKITT